jgi:hypothetical protein
VASSTPPSVSPSRALTAEQVYRALLTDAEVPNTKINPQGENAVINTQQDKVATGGAACQKFIDATELLEPTYGTSAQFMRDLLGLTMTDTRYGLTLAVLPGDGAKRVMADIRAGIAGCHGTYTMADTTAGEMWGSVQEFPVGPLGDSSIGCAELNGIFRKESTSYYEFVQVGSTIVEVTDFPNVDAPVDAERLKEQLATATKTQVEKLEAAQR